MRKMLLEGKTVRQIASTLLGRNESACSNRIRVLGLRSPRLWNEAEVDKLRTLKEEGKTAKEVQSHFPLKSLLTCQRALKNFPSGVPPQRFTEQERQEFLRLRQDGTSLHDIWRKTFPHRTFDDCRKELSRLRLPHLEDARRYQVDHFTSSEVQYIETLNSEGATISEIARALDRPSMSIHFKLLSMDLKYNPEIKRSSSRGRPWSAAEDAVLVRAFDEELPCATLYSLLPQRSTYGIRKRLTILGKARGQARPTSTRWSQADEELLLTLHNDKSWTLDAISIRLQRSRQAITCKLRSLAFRERRMSQSVRKA